MSYLSKTWLSSDQFNSTAYVCCQHDENLELPYGIKISDCHNEIEIRLQHKVEVIALVEKLLVAITNEGNHDIILYRRNRDYYSVFEENVPKVLLILNIKHKNCHQKSYIHFSLIAFNYPKLTVDNDETFSARFAGKPFEITLHYEDEVCTREEWCKKKDRLKKELVKFLYYLTFDAENKGEFDVFNEEMDKG